MMPENVLKVFPKNYFQKEQDYLPLLRALAESVEREASKETEEMKSEQESILIDQALKKDIQTILAQFVLLMSRYVDTANSDFIAELIIMVNMIKWAYEDLSPSYNGKHEISESEKISLSTRLSNALLCEMYPVYLKRINKKGMKYLGKKPNHVFNVIMIIKLWADWMVLNGISHTKIEINTEK